MRLFRGVAALLLAASAFGCSRELWGLPRIAMSSASPDGRWVAFVRNHPTIDGPEQSGWLQPDRGSAVQLRRFGADSEWVTDIVWSADSGRVAFVTMEAVVDVYESSTQSRVASGYLRQPNSGYPPKYAVRGVALSADGRQIEFVPCERNQYVLNDNPERLSCAGVRETLSVATLAERQARLYPGRIF